MGRIVRKALLSAWREKASWHGKTKLVLFAPAHKGARVVRLAEEVIGGFRFLPFVAGIWKFRSPLVYELTPGSPYLTQLEDETKAALAAGAQPLLTKSFTLSMSESWRACVEAIALAHKIC